MARLHDHVDQDPRRPPGGAGRKARRRDADADEYDASADADEHEPGADSAGDHRLHSDQDAGPYAEGEGADTGRAAADQVGACTAAGTAAAPAREPATAVERRRRGRNAAR